MTNKNCITCMRGPQFADGCSHIDCPHRKPYTAQPLEDSVSSSGGSVGVTKFRAQQENISARGDE